MNRTRAAQRSSLRSSLRSSCIRGAYRRGLAVLLALCVIGPVPVRAQAFFDILFRPLTIHDGLSSNNINSIAQDRDGFIWIGTRDGLNRYDGYDVATYHSAEDDTLSLSDDNVWAVLVDHAGRLWIGTGEGLNLYDRQRDRVVRLRLEEGYWQNTRVLFEDRQRRLWIGTDRGLFQRDPDTGGFVLYEAAGGGPAPYRWDAGKVTALGEDAGGRIWVGTRGGLNLLDEARRTFAPTTPLPDALPRIDDEVRHIAADPQGGLWVATQQHGLFHFAPDSPEPERYHADAPASHRLPANSVRFIHLDEGGRPVVGTAAGLSLYDPLRRVFVNHDPLWGDPHGLISNSVRTFFADRQGNWWIGTWEGVSYYARRHDHVQMARAVPGRSSGLQDNNVYALAESADGQLWIGTQQAGVQRFDPATNTGPEPFRNDGRPGALAGSNVHAVLIDRAGTLWVGLFENGLCRRDRNADAFTCYRNNPDDSTSLSDTYVYALFEDRQGRLWVGTNRGGLNRFDPERQAFIRYEPDWLNPGRRLGSSVTALIEDPMGQMWVGTTNGLSRYRAETDDFVTYMDGARPAAGLPSTHILDLYSAPDGTLWVATQDGLTRYDRARDRFVPVALPAVEPNEHARCVLDDGADRLWVMTERRLLLFDPADGRIVDRRMDAGFYRLRFNERACLRGQDGTLYFGSTNGLVRLNPAERAPEEAPPVYLTGLAVSNQPVPPPGPGTPLDAPLRLLDELVLSHEQTSPTFTYAALDFVEPNMTRYAYRLDGYDEAWNEVGTQRTASYTKLPAGTYTFRVRTADRAGTWLEPGAAIALRVLPPWWFGGWARLLYGLVAAALAYGAWRYWDRFGRLRNELALEHMRRESEEALHESQVRFFTNISHEFRTPLTLIKGPIEALQARERSPAARAQLEIVQRNVDRLLYLINQLLDFQKLETGHLKLYARETDLVAFLMDIVHVFEGYALRRSVTLDLDIAHPALPAWFDLEKLETVMMNLVANAVKFTPAGGRVTLHLWRSDDADAPPLSSALARKTEAPFAGIAVRDEGPGIAPDEQERLFERFYQAGGHRQPGTGIGLALARSIVELHGGQLTVVSEPGQGATFIVWLPLGHAPLHDLDLAYAEIDPGEDRIPSIPSPMLQPEAVLPSLADVPGAPPPPPDATRPRVLVVDDNADMRAYLRQCLDPVYSVRAAADAETGLPIALAWQPDLVISDVMLDGMDGTMLCRMLKRDVRTQHIPVMLLTARTSTEHWVEGYEVGADAYVTKPFVLDVFLTQTRNLVLRQQRLKERMEHALPLVLPSSGYRAGDEQFVEQFAHLVEERLDDPDLNVETLSEAMGVSRVHLHKKIKALLNESPSGFIRNRRLHTAAQLLLAGDLTVSEVAYRVGFTTPSHFSTSFRKQYGQSPTEYVEHVLSDAPASDGPVNPLFPADPAPPV